MAFEKDREDLIEGRNAVIEALRAGRGVDKIYLAKGETDRTLGHIAARARDAGVAVVMTDRRKLDALSATGAHQGVIAVAAVKEYCSVEDILAAAEAAGEPPLVVICDEISDPRNFGAILRTAECVGAHGVVIPKRRSAGVTGVVDKASAGAAEHVPVARVPNLPAAIRGMKERGLWICGSAAGAEKSLWETDLTGPLGLVIGSEGEGMGRLVAEHCDFLVRIPMHGRLDSLNAATAAGVLMYEALRQRTAAQK
ncbi:MAG: 23S rRNA (guanosine(2251)-2'-O)-methyltransferase RlmB [Oscillospiraceae bacterium]|nr:23S rRNA (guanosine(2251)-2'-O)-methyltransferase RlmB [Oscillospiraceae bacterium]